MPKIFIVEDDKTIVKMLTNALKSDFQVYSVLNFRAVKQEILEADPDLVLMDIGLPFYNGFTGQQNYAKSHKFRLFLSRR